MRRPIDSYRVTADTREHAARGVGPATDYAAPVGPLPIGTPVRAPFPLASVTRYSTYEGGTSVKATSRDGRFVFYGQHLSGYVTNPGTAEGSVIAYSGNSGANTTGPHLHCYVVADGIRMSMEEAIRKYGLTGETAGGESKPLPIPEEEEMPIYTKHTDTRTRDLPKGGWHNVYLNEKNHTSFASGKCIVTSTVVVQLVGLPEGAEVQFRLVTTKAGTNDVRGGTTAREAVGTPGTTYATVTDSTELVRPDDGVRWQMVVQHEGVVVKRTEVSTVIYSVK